MSPDGCAVGGVGVHTDTPCDSCTLASLYPACLGCRQEIDSLLGSIQNQNISYIGRPSTTSSPGASYIFSASPPRRDDLSRLASRASSSGARSTSSPAWLSDRAAVDTPCDDGGNVAAQQRLVCLWQQLSRNVARLCEVFERERSQLSHQQVLLWQRRVAGLRDDAASLSSAVQAEVGSMQRWMQDEHKQREELLQLREGRSRSRYGRSDTSSAAAVDKEERVATRRWEHQRREEQVANLAWLREREKLQESGMMLETIFAQGRGVLDRVVQQNSVLRSARKKLRKLTGAAGVSSTLIGAAARRQAGDRKLVYGGMLLTLLFFFVMYRFAHSYSFSSLFWMQSPSTDPPSFGAETTYTAVAALADAM